LSENLRRACPIRPLRRRARLVKALGLRWIGLAGVTRVGGSVSYGKVTPYLPVIELLKAYLPDPGARDDPRAIRERVAGKLLTLDPALEPLLTPLLALLDFPVEDAAWDALDPPQRRQRALEADGQSRCPTDNHNRSSTAVSATMGPPCRIWHVRGHRRVLALARPRVRN
jgi:hypothetical protein